VPGASAGVDAVDVDVDLNNDGDVDVDVGRVSLARLLPTRAQLAEGAQFLRELRMIRRFVLLALVVAASPAVADKYPAPVLAPPSSYAPVSPPQPLFIVADPERGPKSPGTAMALSLSVTLLPPLVAAMVWGDQVVGGDHQTELLWILSGSRRASPTSRTRRGCCRLWHRRSHPTGRAQLRVGLSGSF